MLNSKKKTTLPGLSGQVIIPQSAIPPKSPDLMSAYAYIEDQPLVEQLEQIRGQMKVRGQEYVDRIDHAICFLALDVGYKGEEVREILAESLQQLVDEAESYHGKV